MFIPQTNIATNEREKNSLIVLNVLEHAAQRSFSVILLPMGAQGLKNFGNAHICSVIAQTNNRRIQQPKNFRLHGSYYCGSCF